MIIVIDIGNTNVKLVGMEGETVLFSGKVETNREWTAEDYIPKIQPVLAQAQGCQGAILSSVVPPVTVSVGQAVEKVLGIQPIILGPDTEFGLTVALEHPEKVGRDRLVDAAWAAKNMPLPTVTADLGTATTLNVILPGNVFAGGVICAGIETGLKALAFRAAQLPKLELTVPRYVIGRNTEECMISGAVAGTAAMLDGLVQSIEAEIGHPVSLAVTGGGGEYVSPLLHHEHVYDKNLTLKGLALVYEMNRGKDNG